MGDASLVPVHWLAVGEVRRSSKERRKTKGAKFQTCCNTELMECVWNSLKLQASSEQWFSYASGFQHSAAGQWSNDEWVVNVDVPWLMPTLLPFRQWRHILVSNVWIYLSSFYCIFWLPTSSHDRRLLHFDYHYFGVLYFIFVWILIIIFLLLNWRFPHCEIIKNISTIWYLFF